MMNSEEILNELESYLESIDITLKYGRGYFKGGFYRYRDKMYIYLNRANNPENHVELIISEIKRLGFLETKQNPFIEKLLSRVEAN